MVTAANPFEQSADYFNQAGDTFEGVAGGTVLDGINDYINPFYEQVLDKALGRMDTNHQMNMQRVGDSATAAGAFGGGRHGVVEGQAIGEYNKNVGDLSAQMGQQAWNTAAGLSQQDINNQMAAGGALQGLGGGMFNVGNTLNTMQGQSGQQQDDLLNSILQGGAGQFQEMMRNPMQMIQLMQALNQGDARRGAGTGQASSTPGLFDYLSLGAGVLGIL